MANQLILDIINSPWTFFILGTLAVVLIVQLFRTKNR